MPKKRAGRQVAARALAAETATSIATDVYEIRPSAGKGNGVFAKIDIKPGTVIMSDAKVMEVYDFVTLMKQHIDDEVRVAFDKLEPDQQAQFLALHEGHRSFKTKMLRIFKGNCFKSDHSSYILLNISIFNHSCTPNARWVPNPNDPKGKDDVVATQDIARGEEVFICYEGSFHSMTTQQRGNQLRTYYGFTCSCPSCMLQGDARTLSDARRQLIKAVFNPLLGQMSPDFSQLDTLAVAWDENKTLRSSYSFDCSRRKVWEEDAWSTYLGVACRLHDQMMAMKDVTILESARNVKCWMKQSIDLGSKGSRSDDPTLVDMREVWEEMQACQPLKSALHFLNDTKTSRIRFQERNGATQEIFALWCKSDTSPVVPLTEAICKGYLRKSCRERTWTESSIRAG